MQLPLLLMHDAADKGTSSGLAERYLAAFSKGSDFPGGLSYRKALAQRAPVWMFHVKQHCTGPRCRTAVAAPSMNLLGYISPVCVLFSATLAAKLFPVKGYRQLLF